MIDGLTHTHIHKLNHPQGGYIRRDYHANCALQPEYPFQPNIGVDRYWAPPDFYPSNGSYGYEPDSPRPDAAGSTAGGFSVTSALTATHRLTGRTQQQPLLHRVPRQDDGVFVRLAEDDLVKRERNLAALTMVGEGGGFCVYTLHVGSLWVGRPQRHRGH